jgi:hypothetical protein
MFGAKLNDESALWIDGYQMTGVSVADISYSNSSSTANPLGYSAGVTISNADSAKTISISRDLLLTKKTDLSDWEDFLLQYTGLTGVMGASINYENSSYGFKSGYMTEYMLNFAIGSIPKVTTNFTIFDSIYNGNDSSIYNPSFYGYEPFYDYLLPYQSACQITCDNATSNRVVGFDYSIKINRKPTYTIGSSLAAEVQSIPPLEYSASVQIEIDDAFLQNSQNFLTNKENKNVYLSIDSDVSGVPAITFNVPKASLVSEQLSASADGLLKLTLNYVGHL